MRIAPGSSERAWVAALAGAHFVALLALPVVQITDHKFLLMATDSLLRRGTLRLDGLALRDAPLVPGAEARSPDYRVEVAGGHYYHSFPVGTAILSAPLVAAGRAFGVVSVDGSGVYEPRGERRLNRVGAASIVALIVVPFFAIARSFASARASAALTSVVILGSPLTSTASRGLWSHDFGVLLVAFALAHILATERRGRAIRPAWLGSLLAWAFLSRPTFALAAVACVAPLAAAPRTRRAAVGTVVVFAVWLLPFLVWAHVSRGGWLPSYYQPSRLHLAGFARGFVGNLLSPSRGFLVFVPWLVWLAWVAWRRRDHIEARRWVLIAALVTVAESLVVASFPKWYGGHSYGARMMTDVVPWWFMALAIVTSSFGAVDASARGRRNRVPMRSGAALFAIAIALNVVGAASAASWRWNALSGGIDVSVERLWNWREAQFLAPLLPDPRAAR